MPPTCAETRAKPAAIISRAAELSFHRRRNRHAPGCGQRSAAASSCRSSTVWPATWPGAQIGLRRRPQRARRSRLGVAARTSWEDEFRARPPAQATPVDHGLHASGAEHIEMAGGRHGNHAQLAPGGRGPASIAAMPNIAASLASAHTPCIGQRNGWTGAALRRARVAPGPTTRRRRAPPW
jgi:hypothetical protein